MNKVLFLMIATALLLAGCKKDYDKSVFDQSAQDRTQQMLQNYQATLTSSPYGWLTYIFPAGAGPVTFYFKFDTTNRVVNYCDISASAAKTPLESSYRLQSLQTTTLIFDTYSYLHILADPNPNVAGGTAGQGLKSDFEYYLNSVTDDTIKMVGVKNNVQAVMVRATAAQADAFATGKVGGMITDIYTYITAPNSSFHFTLPDSTLIGIDISGRLATFKVLSPDGKTVQGLNVPFSFNDVGLHLPAAFVYNGKAMQDIYWDKASGIFFIMLDGKRINIYPGAPLFPLYPSFGSVYNRIYVTETPSDGSSTSFATAYQQMIASIKSSLQSNLFDMNFVMSALTNKMSIVVRAKAVSNANIAYTSTINYKITYDGTKLKFTYQSADQNGLAIYPYMQSVLNYINNDNFKLEYYQSPTQGLLGRMTSLDHGDFYFTGILSQ